MYPSPNIFGIINDWYDLVLILATIICALFTFYYIKNRTPYSFPIKWILPWAFLSAFIGLVGARLLTVTEMFLISSNEDLPYTFIEYLFTGSGYSFYGGLILNLIVLLSINHFLIKSEKFLTILDVLSISSCLAYALGRVGCHLSGDGCFGIPTNLPWGMYYSYGPEPTLLPVHPTPIYESIAGIFLFLFLIKVDQNKKFAGQTSYIYLMISALLRFSVEFIRINPNVYMNLSMAQLIAMALFTIGFIAYCKEKLSHKLFFNLNML